MLLKVLSQWIALHQVRKVIQQLLEVVLSQQPKVHRVLSQWAVPRQVL